MPLNTPNGLFEFVAANVNYTPEPADPLWLAEATPAPAPRGPDEPGKMWLERTNAGPGVRDEHIVMRTDNQGYRYQWIYLYPEELAQLAKVLMTHLVKQNASTTE